MTKCRAARNDVKFGAVAIGRNEGERLKRCLQIIVELPSSSSMWIPDPLMARYDGRANVASTSIELDMSVPFTAARARNAGFRHLREVASDLVYVQFIDGDCELNQEWPQQAIGYLETHSEVVAVCGRRRERFPESVDL